MSSRAPTGPYKAVQPDVVTLRVGYRHQEGPATQSDSRIDEVNHV